MNQLTLYPVKRATKRSNRYCGPSCLSILTGLDTRDTAALLRSVSGRRRIIGTPTSAMQSALLKLGYSTLSLAFYGDVARKRPTLAQWARANPERQGVTYLMSVGRHWALVQGQRYACGLVDKPVALNASPKWRARVKQVWVIRAERNVMPDAVAVVAALPKVAANHTFLSQTADRLAVKRLAEPHKIEVDGSNRDKDDPDATIWVYPGPQWPEGLADPYDDEHYHYDWASAHKAVATYAAAITTHKERPFGATEPVTFVVS